MRDTEERSQWDPAWNEVPPPTRAGEFDENALARLSDDELILAVPDLYRDPMAMNKVLDELEQRETAERQRIAQDQAHRQWRAQWDAALTPDALAGIDDDQLQTWWNQLDGDPELQHKVESEWDRRAWIAQFREPVETDGDHLTDEQIAELQEGFATLSPADYDALEASMIDDPAQRTAAFRETETKTAMQKRLRGEYIDYQYERYAAAEDECRGHMLNARGRALGIDPWSLMGGNALRMSAYSSDEFKAAIGRRGGHMSFARFVGTRGATESNSKYGAHNAETFMDVADV